MLLNEYSQLLLITDEYRKPFSEMFGLPVPAARSYEPGRLNKAPAWARRGGSGERRKSYADNSGQAPGFSPLLNSKGVLSYTVLSYTQRIKDKVKSEKE